MGIAQVPPRAPPALFTYLLGAWSVAKRLDYQRGGVSGSFAGEASFTARDAGVLSFMENGVATLKGEEFSAQQALLYDCSDERIVRVFFDEASGPRAFHTIDFENPDRIPPFEHPCGPDLYRGRLVIGSANSFELRWNVAGPRKLGSVVSSFRRRPG